jgi:hypothetical protein
MNHYLGGCKPDDRSQSLMRASLCLPRFPFDGIALSARRE